MDMCPHRTLVSCCHALSGLYCPPGITYDFLLARFGRSQMSFGDSLPSRQVSYSKEDASKARTTHKRAHGDSEKTYLVTMMVRIPAVSPTGRRYRNGKCIIPEGLGQPIRRDPCERWLAATRCFSFYAEQGLTYMKSWCSKDNLTKTYK